MLCGHGLIISLKKKTNITHNYNYPVCNKFLLVIIVLTPFEKNFDGNNQQQAVWQLHLWVPATVVMVRLLRSMLQANRSMWQADNRHTMSLNLLASTLSLVTVYHIHD